jgi:hypothetical protein
MNDEPIFIAGLADVALAAMPRAQREPARAS